MQQVLATRFLDGRSLSGWAAALAVAALLAAGPLAAQGWQQLERIDVRPDGQPSVDEVKHVDDVSISDDGRWVVFASDQTDLVADDNNGVKDVFLRDRKTNTTRRLSLRPDGSQTIASSYMPHASRDGRFVSFLSDDSGLVAADNNYDPDVFLLDRDTDANGVFDEAGGTSLTRASVHNNGTQLHSGVWSARAAVSDDGNHVAFASTVKIDPSDNNGESDVYLRDQLQAWTPVMSINSAGVVGDDRSPNFFRPPIRISGDGRFVAFSSEATNLVPDDTNYKTDVFVHDRDSNGNGVFDEAGSTSTVRANVGPGDTQLASPDPFADFDLDWSGRWVAFSVYADPIGNDPNPTGADIYLNHLATGVVSRIDMNETQWAKGDGDCCGNQMPVISHDAGVVIFRSSQLYHFSAGQTSTRFDVLAWTRGNGLTRVTDYPAPTGPDDSYSATPLALSSNGAWAVVKIRSAGPAHANEAGLYVHFRNTVFHNGFEEQTLP